jgi:5'(3')-deoxyribonucleotidase
MRIGFDVDGVLAYFTGPYVEVLNGVSGKSVPVPSLGWHPAEWNFEGSLGFTKEDVRAAWDYIKASRTFWWHLPVLASKDEYYTIEDIALNDKNYEVYFITNRVAVNPKWQTEAWLTDYMPDITPTVLITEKKGLAAAALNLDIYLDDKLENIEDVQAQSVSTRAYLIDRPYNRARDVLRRADSVLDVLKEEDLLGR